MIILKFDFVWQCSTMELGTQWMKLKRVTTNHAAQGIQLVQTVVAQPPLLWKLQALITSYVLFLDIVLVAWNLPSLSKQEKTLLLQPERLHLLMEQPPHQPPPPPLQPPLLDQTRLQQVVCLQLLPCWLFHGSLSLACAWREIFDRWARTEAVLLEFLSPCFVTIIIIIIIITLFSGLTYSGLSISTNSGLL